MSELKARHVVDVYDGYAEHPCEECSQVYIKSEADKVIAEKDTEIAELKQEIARLKKENEMSLVGVNLRSPTSDGRFV